MDLQEIRSDLNTMDSLAGQTIEYLEDNDLGYEDDHHNMDELHETLTALQTLITTIQEQQKWI